MKGQFFIIAAIVIATGLAMISGLLNIYKISETSAGEQMDVGWDILKNIMKEYRFITRVAAVQADPNKSAVQYLSNFSLNIREQQNARILWLAIFMNGTSQEYYVNVGNFMQKRVLLSISVTNSIPSSVSTYLNDLNTASFNFSPQASGLINLTVRYETEDKITEDTISFSAGNTNSLTGFFDIAIKGAGSYVKTKEAYYSPSP